MRLLARIGISPWTSVIHNIRDVWVRLRTFQSNFLLPQLTLVLKMTYFSIKVAAGRDHLFNLLPALRLLSLNKGGYLYFLLIEFSFTAWNNLFADSEGQIGLLLLEGWLRIKYLQFSSANSLCTLFLCLLFLDVWLRTSSFILFFSNLVNQIIINQVFKMD